MGKEIGKVFEFNGVRLQAIETPSYRGCKDCYFQHYTLCKLHCLPCNRPDKKNVIFKEIKEL